MTAVREEPPSFFHLLPTDAKMVLTDYLVHDVYTQDTLNASMEALFPVSMYPCDYAKRIEGLCSCRFCVVENARLKVLEERKRKTPYWKQIAEAKMATSAYREDLVLDPPTTPRPWDIMDDPNIRNNVPHDERMYGGGTWWGRR